VGFAAVASAERKRGGADLRLVQKKYILV